MGPRGVKRKGREFQNRRPPSGYKNKGKTTSNRGRKTYSILANKNQRSDSRAHTDERPLKKPKITSKSTINQNLSESSTEEEEEDCMQQLLQTFNPEVLRKKRIAVDSSDDDSQNDSDEENEQITDSIQNNDETDNEGDVELEQELDIEVQAEDEGESDISDPFARHLLHEISDNLLSALQSSAKTDHVVEWPELGQMLIQIPQCEEAVVEPKLLIGDGKRCAPLGTIPKPFDTTKQSLRDIHIKSQIVSQLRKTAQASCLFAHAPSLQNELFAVMNNYQDLLFTSRTFDNGEQIRFAYCLHVVNHVLKTRTKVLHHNAKLSRTTRDDVPEEYRDQGLVRPKILILVPFRDCAYKIISILIQILIPDDKGNVINKKRFLTEFTGHAITMPKKNPKPEDYERLFSGNTGDDFRIGMSVTKKSLKLFTDFYASDIIIASPLGLRTIIGAEGETERDFDFLASIELLILDQAEIFLMQNWDHLLHIFNHLHLQPKDAHGTDFSRVRTWTLNGWSKYYRQTLIFASLMLPEIHSLFNKRCFNYAGKVKAVQPIAMGAICQVFVQLPHVFQKLHASSVGDAIEARLKFFIDKILPQQRDSLMRQTVIYVPQYFDFVKLRNHFKREDIGFVQICEYSKEGKVARARDMFFHGDAHFLLYTERFHFFNRIKLKGIRHLVFFQPPTFANFYYELCNFMQEAYMNGKVGNASNMTVTVLYSKYDVNQLAGIVGTERAGKMINSDRNVHMLVTDNKNVS